MNVKSFRFFTFANHIVDFTFDYFVVVLAGNTIQFQRGSMVARHNFVVNKPPKSTQFST